MKSFFSIILAVIAGMCTAAAREEPVRLAVSTGYVEGTLVIPDTSRPVPVVIIVAGSGPTDRNGNNGELESNNLKYLADIFLKAGFASLRFDKRGIGQSDGSSADEWEMRIDTFANDVSRWVKVLSKDKRFSRIVIAGHSEGALLGILSAGRTMGVKGLITLAGPGRPLDIILKEQLSIWPEEVRKIVWPMLDQLKRGDTIANVPPIYYGLLRPSIQPFIISMFRYDPRKEISKLKIPVLVVQGLTDLQVRGEDAQLLAGANKRCRLLLVPDMNHALKKCSSMERAEQLEISSKPGVPLHDALEKDVIEFINKIP